MPLIDIMDDTFVAAPPATVAAYVADPSVWRSWWPDFALSVHENRGIEGIRWTVAGRIHGSAEVWIETYENKGCFVHFYLRTDPVRPWRLRAAARARRRTRRLAVAWKRCVHTLKDAVESPGAWQVAARQRALDIGSPATATGERTLAPPIDHYG